MPPQPMPQPMPAQPMPGAWEPGGRGPVTQGPGAQGVDQQVIMREIQQALKRADGNFERAIALLERGGQRGASRLAREGRPRYQESIRRVVGLELDHALKGFTDASQVLQGLQQARAFYAGANQGKCKNSEAGKLWKKNQGN